MDSKVRLMFLLCLLNQVLFTDVLATLNLSACRGELGMQNGAIPDQAITASSFYDDSVGPTNSRIRTEQNGGAWCPLVTVGENTYEYLQIDLGELKVVTLVETQGRFGNGQGQEYVDNYILEYQREPNGPWYRFRNRRGEEVIKGNENQYASVLREVDPAIIARVIRFIPHSELPKFVCMRVEVYGCTWRDGLVSYNMRQGERRGNDIDLLDFTYDGHFQNDNLLGGIGQLADGMQGTSNFRATNHGLDFKGYDWVGWKNDTLGGKPLEITFKFDAVRNFTALYMYCNNMFSKDVRVFKDAELTFSVGGEFYPQETRFTYHYMADTLIEYARQVIIQIPNRIGRYMKVKLHLDARWLMISEVHFESTYAVGNFTTETPPPAEKPIDVDRGIPGNVGDHRPENNNGTAGNKDTGILAMDQGRTSDETVGIIIGVLVTLILLLVVIMIAFCIRQKRSHAGKLYGGRQVPGKLGVLGTSCGGGGGGETPLGATNTNLTMNELSSNYDSSYGCGTATIGSGIKLTNGTLGKLSNGKVYSGLAMTELDPVSKMLDESLAAAENEHNHALAGALPGAGVPPPGAGVPPPGAGVPPPGAGVLSVAGGVWNNPYNHGATLDVLQRRRLPELPRTPESSDTNASREYATPGDFMTMPHGGAKSSVIVNIPPPPPPPRHTPGYNSPLGEDGALGGHYACTDIMGLNSERSRDASMYPSIAGVSGSTLYSRSEGHYGHVLQGTDLTNLEFPRENLKFIEKLGEGQFGEVHLCEATRMWEFLGDDYAANQPDPKPMRVVVKMLRTDVKENNNEHFQREVNIMCGLKDPNIVRVLGVCTRDAPLCVIVEYMRYGDLSQYLKQHVPENTMVRKKAKHRHLSYGCLIYMANQIASGMKYLESIGVVHRDVAARNCLVGPHFQIKVSDFGMSRSLHSCDYYRVEGLVMLPMRWMAWESLLMGKFSSKSDVWSFAVTLWEILTFAREQPFSVMSDEEVIENCARCLQDSPAGVGHVMLEQPSNCPREIYDLMCECWKRDASQRPHFHDIHMFLSNKNVGYDPTKDDRSSQHIPGATIGGHGSNNVPFV